jgi:hypothetical protein
MRELCIYPKGREAGIACDCPIPFESHGWVFFTCIQNDCVYQEEPIY